MGGRYIYYLNIWGVVGHGAVLVLFLFYVNISGMRLGPLGSPPRWVVYPLGSNLGYILPFPRGEWGG